MQQMEQQQQQQQQQQQRQNNNNNNNNNVPTLAAKGSRQGMLNDARGTEPGCVEMRPRNRATRHVRVWLSQLHTGGQMRTEGGVLSEYRRQNSSTVPLS
jgi:hypothetical protein